MNQLLQVAGDVKKARQEAALKDDRIRLGSCANRILLGLERYERVTYGVEHPLVDTPYNVIFVDGVKFRNNQSGKGLEVEYWDDEYEEWMWQAVTDITDLLSIQLKR